MLTDNRQMAHLLVDKVKDCDLDDLLTVCQQFAAKAMNNDYRAQQGMKEDTRHDHP